MCVNQVCSMVVIAVWGEELPAGTLREAKKVGAQDHATRRSLLGVHKPCREEVEAGYNLLLETVIPESVSKDKSENADELAKEGQSSTSTYFGISI